MLEIFTKTFIEFFDKSLSAVLIGAAGCLIILFNYWKIPDRYKEFKIAQESIKEELEDTAKHLQINQQLLRRVLDQIKFLNKQDADSGEF